MSDNLFLVVNRNLSIFPAFYRVAAISNFCTAKIFDDLSFSHSQKFFNFLALFPCGPHFSTAKIFDDRFLAVPP